MMYSDPLWPRPLTDLELARGAAQKLWYRNAALQAENSGLLRRNRQLWEQLQASEPAEPARPAHWPPRWLLAVTWLTILAVLVMIAVRLLW